MRTIKINGSDTSIGVYSSAYLQVTLSYVDVTSNLQLKTYNVFGGMLNLAQSSNQP